jgi:hypothetical protein
VDITETGNYIGIGTTMDNPDWHESGAIVMYDSNGDTLWTRQYAFNYPDDENYKYKVNFYCGLFSKDNSIVSGGTIANYNSDYCDPLIVKTNIAGDTLWTWRIFKGDDQIVINSITETKDGDYVAVGKADKPILSEGKTYAPQRGFIVKLRPNGELIYLKEWTDIEFNYFTDVAINQNGELLISGVYFQHPPVFPDDSYHALLVKTNADGETIFYKQVKYGKNCNGVSVANMSNNDIALIIMFGAPEDLDGVWGFETLLQKYSNSGEIEWTKSIGGVGITNWPYSLISTFDNGSAFCGLYGLNIGNYSWLVKADSLGNGVYEHGWINDISANYLNEEIQIYPNPVNQNLNICIINETYNFNATIHSLDGKEVKYIENQYNSVFVGDLPDGLYIIKITLNNKTYTKKIIVKH